jgi:undecaprenyl-diphosphatase
MFGRLHALDDGLLFLINVEWTSPFLDRFMALVTDFGFWKWPLIGAGLVLALHGGYKGRLFLGLALVAVLVGESINSTVKRVVDRPRPYQALHGIRHVDRHGVHLSEPGPVEKGRSMPSNHVANNVAVALLLIKVYGFRGHLAWIWVGLLAYSRVYTGSHYPSDVLISFLLAPAYTSLLTWLAAQRVFGWNPDRLRFSRREGGRPAPNEKALNLRNLLD